MFKIAPAPTLQELVSVTDVWSVLGSRRPVATLQQDTIPGDETTEAVLTPDGTPVYTSLEYAGDSDWFVIDAAAMSSLSIKFTPTDHTEGNGFDAISGSADIHIYDESGNTVAADLWLWPWVENPYYGVTFQTREAGRYFVEIEAYYEGEIGDYQLEATEKQLASDNEIAIGEDVTGRFQAYDTTLVWPDRDTRSMEMYSVELTAGDRVRITMSAVEEADPYDIYAINPELFVYDSDGKLLRHNDNRLLGETEDAALFITPENTGTYYIEARDADRSQYSVEYVLAVRDAVDRPGLFEDCFVFADTPLI